MTTEFASRPIPASRSHVWHPLRDRSHAYVLEAIGCALIVGWALYIGLAARIHILWPGANYWDYLLSTQIPGAAIYRAGVSWVPQVLPTWMLEPNGTDPRLEAAMVAYLSVLALLFALYASALWWISTHRAPDAAARRARLLVIGAVGVACSVLMLFSPAAPSHDPIAYGAVGRLLGTYHANPYFVLPSAFPHDPLLTADEWSNSTQAYGPVWTLLSTLLNPLVAGDPLRSIMVYRVLALVAHVANMVLIIKAQRYLPFQHAAWQDRAMLLYAWNPLVIIEVGAGHNDVLLLTLVLLAVTLTLRGHVDSGLICLVLAVLLKASALPVLCVALLGSCILRLRYGWFHWRQWVAPLRTVGMVACLVLLGYAPFLWGHSLGEINQAS